LKVRKYFHDKGTLSKILTNKYAIANRKNIKKGVSTFFTRRITGIPGRIKKSHRYMVT